MLIDKNGKIAYKTLYNTPVIRNFEQDLDDLLAGKEITLEKEESKAKELS
jgi:hypothetical protein